MKFCTKNVEIEREREREKKFIHLREIKFFCFNVLIAVIEIEIIEVC